MTFKCYVNNQYVGYVYAPGYNIALERAIKLYGLSVEIEEP